MIVAEDDGFRPSQDSRPKDFPRAGLRAVERAHAGNVNTNDVVFGIYEQHGERFAVVVPDDLAQDRRGVSGPADGARLRLDRAFTDERDANDRDPEHS